MKKKKKVIKTKALFKAWIEKIIKFYSPILGISLHRILIEFDAKQAYLAITCTYPYLDPTIKYSEKAFKDWSKGKLEKDRILHELIHILTDPLYNKALGRFVSKDEIEDEREKLTDTLSAIIRKLI